MQLLQLHHKPMVHLSAKWKAQYKLLPTAFHCETQLHSFQRQHEIGTHLVQRPKKKNHQTKNPPKRSISLLCRSLDYCVVIWILVLSWWFVSRSFLKLAQPYWLLTYAVETGVTQRKIQLGILYPSYQAACIAMVSHVLIIPLGVSSFDVPLFFHYYSLYLSIISSISD